MSRLLPLLRSGRPLVMGILNVTPDSFSDGGEFIHPERAIAYALEMARDGADIVDVGGESTRPGASPVSAAEELDRVLPVVQAIRQQTTIPVSLDTSKTAVMAEALPFIDLVNDVGALQDEGALHLMSRSSLPICLMHMKGQPRTMQENPAYDDVVAEVRAFFEDRIAACQQAGIALDRLLLDIGFGFGKTAAHNLTLINQLDQFLDLGAPLLVGLSRKSTIAKIAADRLVGSVAGALYALNRGATILRVHDVKETVTAVRVWRSFAEEQVVPGNEKHE